MPNEEQKAIQRQIGLWSVLTSPAIMAIVFVVQFAFASTLSIWWLLPCQIVVIGVMVLLQARHAHRLRSKIVGAAGRVCIHCSYSLAGLPAPGACPECGRAYPHDAYAAAWVREWPQMLGKYAKHK